MVQYLYLFVVCSINFISVLSQAAPPADYYYCANTTNLISCPIYQKIRINEALYGKESLTCTPNNTTLTNCTMQNVTQLLQNQCNNQQMCTFNVTDAVYGNETCSNVPYKYLQVNYTCNNITLQCGKNEHPATGVCACSDRCPSRRACPLYCLEYGCQCDIGYRRDINTNRCIPTGMCPSLDDLNECHEVFSECASREPTCQNPGLGWNSLWTPCLPGYMCRRGYIRDVLSNRCVRRSECSPRIPRFGK